MNHRQSGGAIACLSLFLILMSACDPIQLGSQTQHVVDLADKGLVTVEITGVSMDALALHIASKSDEPLEVSIPAGTYFVAQDPSVQNMVARHAASAAIKPGAEVDVKLDAACASLHLAEPGRTDTFAMVRTSELPEVTKVIEELNSSKVDYPVEQAAIWLVTDDATYDELGMLVGGSKFGSALIEEDEAVRAMMLVDQAGVDILKYAIWNDRYLMLPKVTDADLITWLSERGSAAPALSIPTAGLVVPLQRPPTAQPGETGAAAEISQFATQALGSSEFSATDWSAMQATGAPNTPGCGDFPTAWSSAHSIPEATLELFFDQMVIPKRIVIYETFNPGAIIMVEAVDFVGGPVAYQGTPTVINECPRKMTIDITGQNAPVSVVKLTLVQENGAWDQIDAVELIGVSP